MSVAVLSADKGIHELLQNFIKSEGLNADSKIDIQTCSEAGDGYLGLTGAVEITSENKVVKLFVKFAPKSDTLRSQFDIKEVFHREIYFYDVVYPRFLKFQVERNVRNPFKSVAKCYGTISEIKNEALLLKNLKEEGYVLFDRKTQMNVEHISFVLRECAKFHAVSYAMKDQEPQLYENISERLDDFFHDMITSAGFDKTLKNYIRNVQKLFDPEDAFIARSIRNLPEELLDFSINAKNFVDEYSVILHGDCWCNNMMFKYTDILNQNSPSQIKILDWQLMRVNSPVFDLSYFFYSVATKEAMNNLDFYLKLYHDNLSDKIKELGSNPDKIYPYSVFKEQWRKFSRFGLLMAITVIKIMLTDKDEAPNLTQSVETGPGIADAFFYNIRKEELYNERARDVVEHFVENKFLEEF